MPVSDPQFSLEINGRVIKSVYDDRVYIQTAHGLAAPTSRAMGENRTYCVCLDHLLLPAFYADAFSAGLYTYTVKELCIALAVCCCV